MEDKKKAPKKHIKDVLKKESRPSIGRIDLVRYKCHEEDKEWKIGLRVNEGSCIVGEDGKEIGECFDYLALPSFALDLSPIVKKEQDFYKDSY